MDPQQILHFFLDGRRATRGVMRVFDEGGSSLVAVLLIALHQQGTGHQQFDSMLWKPLSFLNDCCVDWEVQVFSKMDSQKLDVADPIHSSTMNGYWNSEHSLGKSLCSLRKKLTVKSWEIDSTKWSMVAMASSVARLVLSANIDVPRFAKLKMCGESLLELGKRHHWYVCRATIYHCLLWLHFEILDHWLVLPNPWVISSC